MVVRHLKGMPLRLKCGQPRVLDTISHENVGATIRDVDVLNRSISDEYAATRIRRLFTKVKEIEDDGRAVKVPRRSLKRYAEWLHPQL